jgi:hypothetical protein
VPAVIDKSKIKIDAIPLMLNLLITHVSALHHMLFLNVIFANYEGRTEQSSKYKRLLPLLVGSLNSAP